MNSVNVFNPMPKALCLNYARKSAFAYQKMLAARAGKDVYENEINKLNNLPSAREARGKISVQQVFKNHWSEFLAFCAQQNVTIRESILVNVEKMINCKNLKNGYLFYECTECNNYHIQGFSCHSRFCVSCGKKYKDARANEISNTVLDVPHRHITFTIAKELRPYFQKHREMLDFLFQAVNDVFTFLIRDKSNPAVLRNERLGFISTIHTFGRDLKFNPHIHTLIAECTLDKNGKIKKYEYFNYASLRQSFMKQLLDRMKKHIKEKYNDEFVKFQILVNRLYKRKKSGFYVHAPKVDLKNKRQIKTLVNYVCRYAGHPAISESRITEYDKDKKTISYYYDPHEDDAIESENDKIGRQFVTESVYKFISKLIVHISDKNVHTTRYYGFYANHTNLSLEGKEKLFTDFEIEKMKENQDWRKRLLSSYKYDPLICYCGAVMVLNEDLSFIPEKKKEYG